MLTRFSDDRPQTSPGRLSSVLATAFLCLGCSAAGPGIGRTATPVNVGSALVDTSTDDLGFLVGLLEDPAVPSPFRRQAATRLASSGSTEAALVIARVLRDGDETVRVVVLEGIRLAAPLPLEMVQELVVLVEDAVVSPESAALVLAGIPPEAVRLVVARMEAGQERDRRVLLQDLLGRLGDPLAPRSLVDALGRTDDEIELASIDAALRRWSNMRGRMTTEDWQAWWNSLSMEGDQSQGMRRLANRIAREAARASAAEARALEAETRADRMAVRIAELHARLLALLPESEQLTRIQNMLRDDEPQVRLAAIGQVERMLQDARVLPDGIRQDLIGRLGDVDPAIRIRSAEVLDAMGAADFGVTLVRSLENESDPAVIRAGLRVLGSRPRPEAVAFAIDRLRDTDGETERLAARVIASVAIEGALDPADREMVRRRFAEDRGSIDTRDEARLAVLLADQPDMEIALLDAVEEPVRRGAAEAYRTLGRRDLLLAASVGSAQGSRNEAVARVAIQAWAATDDSVGTKNVEALIDLRPDPQGPDAEVEVATWRAAMGRILEAMPVVDIAASEELLREEVELLEVRWAMLRRGASPESSLSPELRADLQALFGRNLLVAGRPLEAAAQLRAAGGEEIDSPLRGELFTALLLAEEWDDAFGLNPVPEAWIAFLEGRLDLETEFGRRLADEIERRFEGRLDDAFVVRIDAVRDRFAPTTTLGG